MMAQAGHAFLHAFWDAQRRHPLVAEAYQNSNAAVKIVLAGANEAALLMMEELAKPHMGCSLVRDAARTVFKVPIVTFLGLGPITQDQAPGWLRKLNPLT